MPYECAAGDVRVLLTDAVDVNCNVKLSFCLVEKGIESVNNTTALALAHLTCRYPSLLARFRSLDVCVSFSHLAIIATFGLGLNWLGRLDDINGINGLNRLDWVNGLRDDGNFRLNGNLRLNGGSARRIFRNKIAERHIFTN